MSIETDAGGVILGGLLGTHLRDDERADLSEGRMAGVVLYQHTITAPTRNLNGSLTQLTALCAEIKAAAPNAIIALDHEGGRVQRVRHPEVDLPSPRVRGGRGKGRTDTTRTQHMLAGKALKTAGVSFILGPVADVCDGDDNDPIGDRSFGATPQTVATHAKSAVRGYQDAGIVCCAKHWPGIGGGACDAHFGRVETAVRTDHEAIFSDLGAPAVMLGHTTLTDVDPTQPATLSPAAYQRARAQLGSACVLCTDDLNMSAIAAHYGVPDAAIRAIEAGADLVLVGASPLQHQMVYATFVERARTNEAFAQRLKESAARVSTTLKRETMLP